MSRSPFTSPPEALPCSKPPGDAPRVLETNFCGVGEVGTAHYMAIHAQEAGDVAIPLSLRVAPAAS